MTDERARWVEVLRAGKVAQLVVNNATGGLCILAGPEVLEDASPFAVRAKAGAFPDGVEIGAEIRDPVIVSEIRHWNRDLEIPY
jgi:hypothetical protein